jgi:hypothetical protein
MPSQHDVATRYLAVIRLHNSANDNLCNQLHDPLDDRVAFYVDAARSSATRRAYAFDMAAFSAWGGRVPASPETVASYLAASASLAAATLRRRLAAIADAHQIRVPRLLPVPPGQSRSIKPRYRA